MPYVINKFYATESAYVVSILICIGYNVSIVRALYSRRARAYSQYRPTTKVHAVGLAITD